MYMYTYIYIYTHTWLDTIRQRVAQQSACNEVHFLCLLNVEPTILKTITLRRWPNKKTTC